MLHPGGKRTFIAGILVESRPFVALPFANIPSLLSLVSYFFPMGGNDVRVYTIAVGIVTRWVPIVPESVYAPSGGQRDKKGRESELQPKPISE